MGKFIGTVLLICVPLVFAMTSCIEKAQKENSDKREEELHGYYECVSNEGRKTLGFNSTTMDLTVNIVGESSVSFTTIGGTKYTLYQIKDSDYHCGKVSSETKTVSFVTVE